MKNIRTTIYQLTAASVFLAGGAISLPAAANPGPGSGCVTNVGLTIRSGTTVPGSYIKGSGSMACNSTASGVTRYLNVRLEKKRWWGWDTIRSETAYPLVRPFNVARGVSYACTGTGTYTYRTRVEGGDAYNPRVILHSNEIRTNCS